MSHNYSYKPFKLKDLPGFIAQVVDSKDSVNKKNHEEDGWPISSLLLA
jgi:hypothetical protein